MKLIAVLLLIIGSVSYAVASPTYAKAITPEDARSGMRGMRIVNGWEVTNRGDIPHYTRMLAPAGGGYVVCGGTLISNNHILIAAHCTWGMGHFIMGFGIIDWNEPAETIDCYDKREHPGYNGQSLNNDISLLYLSRRIEFTGWVQPARLPHWGMSGDQLVGAYAVACGFGADNSGNLSNKLRATHLRVISQGECQGTYGGWIGGDIICCRGWEYDAQSTCGGDSGGPLVIDSNLHVGVVSFVSGRGCASGDPSGYARTTTFLQWIQDNTGIGIAP